MENFLKALPIVASHPLALVGYLAVVMSWLIVSLQVRKASKLFAIIKALPEEERLEAIKLEYRTTPRAGLSSEQWLQSRRTTFLFAAFAATLFTIIVLAAFAFVFPVKSEGRSAGNQATMIESVVGNVYVTYSEAAKQADKAGITDEGVVFVTEDVRFPETLSTPLHQKDLDVRFTIYNNSQRKIKIYNFHTVEYEREHTIFYIGRIFQYDIRKAMLHNTGNKGHVSDEAPRRDLEISPDKAFIEENKTFEIDSRQSVSFRLRFNMKIGPGGAQVILGVIAYYHIPSGELGKVKSNKLFLVNPTFEKVQVFDSSTASSLIQDFDNSERVRSWLNMLLNAWDRHQSL